MLLRGAVFYWSSKWQLKIIIITHPAEVVAGWMELQKEWQLQRYVCASIIKTDLRSMEYKPQPATSASCELCYCMQL